MEEKYKDWAIKYDEDAETFVATDKMENKLRSQKLKNLKKKIDKFKFKRIPVICGHSYDSAKLYLGEITSIADEGDPSRSWRNPEVWISYTDEDGEKSRMKSQISYVYKVTDDNAKIFDEIAVIRDKRNALNKKMDALKEKLELEKITRKDLGIEEE